MDLLRFIKMQGLGNDFVVVDYRERARAISEGQIRLIADRRRGVGCDQLIILERPKDPLADVFMRIYNADGGRVAACGNATRCVALLLMRQKNTRAVTIQTEAGLLPCRRTLDERIAVDMGRPRTRWQDIPLAHATDPRNVTLSNTPFAAGYAVNIGNPHVVVFVENVEDVDLERWGPLIERDPLFPEGVNVEVAQVSSRDRVRMRVWERGVGITPACGTGACAVAVAALDRQLTDREVTVAVDGGELTIEIDHKGHVHMAGPAATTFTGILDPSIVG